MEGLISLRKYLEDLLSDDVRLNELFSEFMNEMTDNYKKTIDEFNYNNNRYVEKFQRRFNEEKKRILDLRENLIKEK